MSYPRASPSQSAANFTISTEEAIGTGNFSTVYSMKMPLGGSFCAVKVFVKQQVTRLRKVGDVYMEKHALSRLNHPRILFMYQTFTNSDSYYVVSELCAGGELWGSCRYFGEPTERAKVYFTQLLDAVGYMHRMGICHRDLKAENVFLSGDGSSLKIGDFGSSRDLYNPSVCGSGIESVSSSGSQRRSFRRYVGTPNFMSPEAIENSENDELSDIWSLGCLFYQVLIGIPPFVAGSEYLVFLRVRALDIQFPLSGVPSEAVGLIKRILKPARTERPTIESIQSDAFFQGTPLAVRQLTPIEVQIKAVSRETAVDLNEEFIGAFSPNVDVQEKLRMIRTVREWKQKSAPGTGTAILDHLDLPELKMIS